MALRYVTLSAVQSFGQISGNSAILSAMISRAECMVDDICGRKSGFTLTNHTEYFSGHGGAQFVLTYTPVNTSGMTVKLFVGKTTSTTLSSTAWRVQTDAGILSLIAESWSGWDSGLYGPTCFLPGHHNYQVVYLGGYSVIPLAIEQATIDVALYLWHRRLSKIDPGMSGENLGGYSYTRRMSVESLQNELIGPGGLLAPYVAQYGLA